MLYETQIAIAPNKVEDPADWSWQEELQLMSRDRMDCLMEVRVEQFADEIAKFSFEMHFQPDIQYSRINNPKAGDSIAILTGLGDENHVLVGGIILEVNKVQNTNGEGLSIRYSGVDVRRALASEGIRCSYKGGGVKEVVETVLSRKFSELKVDAPENNEPSEDAPLTQTGNYLEFIKSTASAHGFHFWVSYKIEPARNAETIKIIPEAHFQASPFLKSQSASASASGLPIQIPLIAAPTPTQVKVFVAPDDCPNVVRFELNRNSERQNTIPFESVDPASLSTKSTYSSEDKETSYQLAPNSSNIILVVPDAPDNDARARTQSELVEMESSFVASAVFNSKKNLLGHILQPHQIITVRGVDPTITGDTEWRVKDVVHVVRQFTHFQDATIETNKLPAAEDVEEGNVRGIAL